MNSPYLNKTAARRKELFQKIQDLDEESAEYKTLDSKLDLLRLDILEYIRLNYQRLGLEDTIEAFNSTGCALSVIYDDNGRYAIGCDGAQPIYEEPADTFSGSWWFDHPKDAWQPTIRRALQFYIRDFFKDFDYLQARKDIEERND